MLTPLNEYSAACSGCRETPYIKLLTQLWGDRLLIANATGCSSIYWGNLPSTPYTTDREGRGPAWANSLFEDNAEFGLGFRLTTRQRKNRILRLLDSCRSLIPPSLFAELQQPAEPSQKRQQIEALRRVLESEALPQAAELSRDADALVDKSVWLIGGDGWAYDIGYGGLDHVLSTDANSNVPGLDTQSYVNTGREGSKAKTSGCVEAVGDKC